jgi:alginate O-acetyltransferase complex protein AlgJ
MPPTAPRPPSAHELVLRLHAATFVLVLAFGAASMLVNPALLRRPDASLRDGAWARAYQADLDAASPLRPPTVAMWNALDLRVFGQAPTGVVLGEGGWLFSDEEYALPADPPAVRDAWFDLIADVAARLDRDGARLLVVLVPSKASLVTVGQPPLPGPAARRYADALTQLRARGVEAVDLRPALGELREAAWLRTDTHWTPAGATAAAVAVARRLRALDPGLSGDGVATLEPGGTETVEGDLVRLLELGPLRPRFGPAAEVIELQRLVRHDPPASDLFATVELPVVVVGTSYAADARWNLAARLEAALEGTPVLDAAEVGRGPAAPMAAYLSDDAYRGARPRAVVWEVPERYLDDAAALVQPRPAAGREKAARP